VETQAIAGMGVHRLHCEPDMIRNSEVYKGLFDEAFPQVPESERYSDHNAALAIAAYERTVLTNQAPFQNWLRGSQTALSESQLKGALLFFGKAECYQCHSGPALNSETFHAIGLSDFTAQEVIGNVDESTRKGRGGFSKNPADDYAFKTPTLYNLKGLKFLGHGGSVHTVREMVEYKNEAVSENPEVPQSALSRYFVPLELTPLEIEQLTDFVENGLYDPNLERYVPENLPSGQCFPVADPQSLQDLGCD
jgi:cytochrome c peroxidase